MRTLIAVLALAAVPVFAAFDETEPRPDLGTLRAEIEAGSAGRAITPLRDWLVNHPKDADALNLLGYAYRKLGHWSESRTHYERALAVDPTHKGALEYMGELELQTGNPGAARLLLDRLHTVCPNGCLELDDLIQAFGEHGVETGEGS